MNERISQLIKQSYVTNQSPRGEEYTYFSQEKFAELIVRECAYIAARAQDENMGWDISGIIKEHFGVTKE